LPPRDDVRPLAPALLAAALVFSAAACSDNSSTATPPSSAVSTITSPPTTSGPVGSVTSTSAAAATTTSGASTACAKPHAPGQTADAFMYLGVNRTYQLYVPRSYTGTRAVPLLFNFHGFGSNAIEQMVYGNFKPLADRFGFVIVAPDGQGAANRHFNLTNEPGLQNDLQMVGALLDHLEASLCIDARRVYSSGMSDGGAMTSLLACTASNRFAAFAPVAVVLSGKNCAQARRVPIMAFSGTKDPIVPFNGGKVNCCGGATVGSAPAAMAGWAAHNACRPTPVDVHVGSDVVRRTWRRCGGTTVFYIVVGGGHTWPGSPINVPGLGVTTHTIDASNLIWRFFATHRLPA